MTERTEVCLQKSVCVQKCLEDRRWWAGNMQASPPCILLQTSISHWFDFILRVRTALLIAANSCNSVVIPNIQSSFFPNKDNFWSSVKWDDDTVTETCWAEVILFQSRYKQFINGAPSKPIPACLLTATSLTPPLGCWEAFTVLKKLLIPSPACLGETVLSPWGNVLWGQAGLETSSSCADPLTLHRTTLGSGQQAGL